MKVLAKEIILLLHDKGCNPTKTNFQGFWAQVEEILLWKSGLNRANVSEKSAKDVMESSHKFAKTCRKLYDRFGGKFDQYSEHEFFNQEIEIDIRACQTQSTSSAPQPSASVIPVR